MNDMTEIVGYQFLVYIPEFFAILLVASGILREKLCVSREILLFLVLGNSAYLLRSFGVVAQNTNIGCIILLLLFLCYWRKTKNLLTTLQVVTATAFIVFAEEILIMAVMELLWLIMPWRPDPMWVNAVGSILTAIISYTMYHHHYLIHLFPFVFEKNRLLGRLVVAAGGVCMGGAVWFQLKKQFTNTEALLFCSFTVLFLLALEQWKKAAELGDEKDRRMRLQQMCQESYEQLLLEVRNRQHEFQNHLTALQGMCYFCQSIEELTQVQSRYCDRILSENKYNKLLYGSSNPMIGGFLYSKFSKAEEKGVVTRYEISLSKNGVDAFDLIEILGVLYDNAVEAVENGNNRQIDIRMTEETDVIRISVGNPGPYHRSGADCVFFPTGGEYEGKRARTGACETAETGGRPWGKDYNGKYNKRRWKLVCCTDCSSTLLGLFSCFVDFSCTILPNCV